MEKAVKRQTDRLYAVLQQHGPHRGGQNSGGGGGSSVIRMPLGSPAATNQQHGPSCLSPLSGVSTANASFRSPNSGGVFLGSPAGAACSTPAGASSSLLDLLDETAIFTLDTPARADERSRSMKALLTTVEMADLADEGPSGM